jgi:transposase
MLVESLVKETVELQGFRVAEVIGGTTGLASMIAADRRVSHRCGRCLEAAPYRDTRPVRRFRHVPTWGIAVKPRHAPRRVSCPRCGGVHVEAMPRVSRKQRSTRASTATLARRTRALPSKQLARRFRCAWGTVARAGEEGVAHGLAQRDLDGPTHIGTDEISRKRGQSA